EKLQQGFARNKIGLARLHHLGTHFIWAIGNHRIETENISRLGKFRDDGFAFARRGGKFRLSRTEYKDASGLLPFNEEHGSLGINSGGFDFVESLSSLNRKVTE